MKKKLLAGLAVITIAAIVTLNLNFSTEENKLSNISLANMEALANNESHDVDCSKEGGECNIKAPNGYTVVVNNYQKP